MVVLMHPAQALLLIQQILLFARTLHAAAPGSLLTSLPFNISQIKFPVLPPKRKDEPLTSDDVEERSSKFVRIVGGTNAPKHKYPSIVLMNIYGSQKCAGTIIDSEWVVSASHCVLTENPKYYEFLAGKHDSSKSESTQQVVKAVNVIAHEKFNSQMLTNDISLFKVSPKFKFDAYVKKAKLPKTEWKTFSGMANAVGWGLTKEGGSVSRILQEVEVPLMSLDKCRSMYSKDDVYDSNICAGYDEGGKDACQGDSGGPLYFNRSGTLYHIGITSWGAGCARVGKPGVYTDVSHFLDWIQETKSKYRSIGEPIQNQSHFLKEMRADGKCKIQGNAGATGDSDGSDEEPGTPGQGTPKRAQITTALAESMCKQYDNFKESRTPPPPIRQKPSSSIMCGFFRWSSCGGESCAPFNLSAC